VKPYAGRLIGFCSENPLKDYAVKEIKRCASIGLRGLKLQFATSDVDLQNPDHIEKLKAVFSTANAVGLPILVHLHNCKQKTYGVSIARNFIERSAALCAECNYTARPYGRRMPRRLRFYERGAPNVYSGF
jgi:predicted TIM-barrel fold metal-dependent hydrolase